VSDEFVVPDVTDYIIAARVWKTKHGPGGMRSLKSVGVEELWPEHRPIVAECKRQASYFAFAIATWQSSTTTSTTHDAPQEGCQCGVWGLASPLKLFDLAEGLRGAAPVFGVIQMWGRVVHGPDGWRGQYARPMAVVARSGRIRKAESEAATTYGIPILTDWPRLTAPYSLPDVPDAGVERRAFQPPGSITEATETSAWPYARAQPTWRRKT
jgi:hypothetical protein